jgi:capsule biosynthesis phosphatase
MLQDQHVFNAIIINGNDFNCVGTPHQLKMYALQQKNNSIKRFCFDIDNTLIISDKNYDNYSIIEKNVNYLKFLKSMGHTIILYTARRMRTHNGCQGKVIADIGKKTIDCLQVLDIPYDEIYFGKPYADFYIDDLAINAYYDLEKETGFYQNNIKERDFNNISIQQLDVIVKKGDPQKIKAEIFYYNNIPQTVKHLFPFFIKSDNNSYTIEQIHGINISYFYVRGNMINDIFEKILKSLHSIHSIDTVDIQPSIIYEHYINRLKQRFLDPIYSTLKYADDIYNKLLTFFNFYINKGIIKMYHGDPVFTNIMLNNDNNIVFIDMRGIVNNTMSIYGDIMYDFAKIYQSLLGYDEIMHNIFLPNNYSTIFIEKLFNFVKNMYGEEYVLYIKMITYSHIFTLLPLHPYEKAVKYYSLIDKNDIDNILDCILQSDKSSL